MQRRPRRLAACLLGLALALGSPVASARPTVQVTRVEVRAGDDGPRLARELKTMLAAAARRTNFGRGNKKDRIELSAKLTEFTADEHDGVLQIRCALHGRVAGGRGAHSRISYGGSPKDRQKLEQQVLKMVADGLIARLAQIARQDSDASR